MDVLQVDHSFHSDIQHLFITYVLMATASFVPSAMQSLDLNGNI
jgi:hypothetical protein